MDYKEFLTQNNEKIENLIAVAETLPDASGGVELPTLDNPGTSADLLNGKQLIGQDGNIVNGAFTIDNEINEQANLITQLQDVLGEGETSGGGSSGGTTTSLDICTIEVTRDVAGRLTVVATTVNNGQIGYYYINEINLTSCTVENVLCGSFFYVGAGYSAPGHTLGGGVENIGNSTNPWFIAPTEKGTIGTVYAYDDM